MNMIAEVKVKNGMITFPATIYPDGTEVSVEVEELASLTDKQKLYAYYHKVVLRMHATPAFRRAGYEGEDEVTTDYRLRSMFAKIHLKKPDGSFDIAIEDKKKMTKARLLDFVTDVIHFLETEMQEMVSDSEEFKIWKATGKKMSRVR